MLISIPVHHFSRFVFLVVCFIFTDSAFHGRNTFAGVIDEVSLESKQLISNLQDVSVRVALPRVSELRMSWGGLLV